MLKMEIKKIPKRFVSWVIVVALLLSYFTPITKVYASASTRTLNVTYRGNNNENGHVEYSLDDGSTWNMVNTDSNLNISVYGNNLKIRIVPNTNYTVDYTGIELLEDENNIGGLSSIGLDSQNGYSVPSNVLDVSLKQVEFSENIGGSAGADTSNYPGNGTSTLNYSINGAIEYTSGGGFDHGISFRINGIRYRANESKMVYTEGPMYERDEHGQIIMGDNNQPIPVLDPETLEPLTEQTGLTITGDTINYDYDTNTNKVDFTFLMSPGTLMTGLTINGQEITNLPKTSAELEAVYHDHNLEIEVSGIDVSDTYDIEITARYPNSSEEFMGNFLWDYNPDGYTGPDDKILHGTLEFVKAEFDGHVYTTTNEIESLGGVYIWQDAQRKDNYTNEREGLGEAQFPKGTELTLRIIPDAGYQLIDFGVNGGVFEPQEEFGVYTFTVDGGPFHLQATIEEVNDEVQSNSQNVKSGSIDVNAGFENGTAKLEVNDIASLSPVRMEGFENKALEEGYDLENYLDIALYNSIYKGGKKDVNGNYESWDAPIENIQNKATITLELENDMSGKDLAIIHETHNGSEITGYEIINATYNASLNTVTFDTDSFSNYAIVSKNIEDLKEYVIEDENGNIVIFNEEEGLDLHFNSMDIMNLTDEEILSLGVTIDEFNEIKKLIIDNTNANGTLIGLYEFNVTDQNGNEHADTSNFGSVEIRLLMTEEMKKYNTFKLINIKDDFSAGDIITLSVKNIDGKDYLVGTLPHLSIWSLNASYVEQSTNPKTSDNINMWVMVLMTSITGFIIGSIKINKILKNKNNK